ncbi:MAG TPA: DUF4349 domain-containing protein [Polyangiaceae bacterium]
MKSPRIAACCLLGAALLVGGCRAGSSDASSGGAAPAPASKTAPAPNAGAAKAGDAVPAERKIARKAALSLEVGSTGDAQAKATRIGEAQGGYVVSSEDRTSERGGRGAGSFAALVLRVPAARFSATLSELRRLGQGAGTEQVSSEDVTEEFIDLEARIKNQRALEERFLEILKSATKVDEALHVEREIAAVRTEIDRMEGRRRFLERETAFSTITLSFFVPEPLVRASFSEFGTAIRRAYGDSLTVAAGILTGGIRLLGVFAPVVLLLGLPALLVLRFVLKRSRKSVPVA